MYCLCFHLFEKYLILHLFVNYLISPKIWHCPHFPWFIHLRRATEEYFSEVCLISYQNNLSVGSKSITLRLLGTKKVNFYLPIWCEMWVTYFHLFCFRAKGNFGDGWWDATENQPEWCQIVHLPKADIFWRFTADFGPFVLQSHHGWFQAPKRKYGCLLFMPRHICNCSFYIKYHYTIFHIWIFIYWLS